MAPEVMENKDYTFAADVWSFGCLIYLLLTGTGPFDHTGVDSQEVVLARSKACNYARIPDSVSNEGRDFVNDCLVVDQQERATIPQLLAHPWLSPSNEDEESKLMPLIGAFANLRVFQKRRDAKRGKLYKVAMMIHSISRIHSCLKQK